MGEKTEGKNAGWEEPRHPRLRTTSQLRKKREESRLRVPKKNNSGGTNIDHRKNGGRMGGAPSWPNEENLLGGSTGQHTGYALIIRKKK